MERIGKYEIRRKLGEGATSEVFLGYDAFRQREVVILNSGRIFTYQKHRIFIEQGYNKHRPRPAGTELLVCALFTIAKTQVDFIGTE